MVQNYIAWPFQRTAMKYNLHEIAVCYKFRFVNTLHYTLQLFQLHVLVQVLAQHELNTKKPEEDKQHGSASCACSPSEKHIHEP